MLVVAFLFMVMAFVVVMLLFFMLMAFVIVMARFFMLVVAFLFMVMAFVVVMIVKNRSLPVGKYQHAIYFRQIQGIGRGRNCFEQRL